MIPSIEILNNNFTEEVYHNKTYKLISNSGDDESPSRINGFVDDIESIKQAIQLILSTERYAHVIYSWDYGIELVDLFGKPMSYVISELPRRIEDALLVDDRISSVSDFKFEKNRKRLHVSFTVTTKLGNNIETGLEVDV